MHNQSGFRSRRTTPPTAQGRWSLNAVAFDETRATPAGQTAWSHAVAGQLLTRYGVVFRETAHAEDLPGGFSAIYDVLKLLEESGKIRRGYFAADLGATQFAQPAAVDLLRSLRPGEHNGAGNSYAEEGHETVLLAATDPANPYGSLLRWPGSAPVAEFADLPASDPTAPGTPSPKTAPTTASSSRPEAGAGFPASVSVGVKTRNGDTPALLRPATNAAATPGARTGALTRSVGARVILIDGALTAYLRRGNPDLQLLLPDEEPARSNTMRTLAEFLVQTVQRAESESNDRNRGGMLITAIGGTPVAEHPIARFLLDAGFQAAPMGFNVRRNLPPVPGRGMPLPERAS